MQTRVDITMFESEDDLDSLTKADRSGATLANLTASKWDIGDWVEFINEIGKETYNLSKSLVPVDTGRLRDSAKFSFSGSAVSISYNTPYASYVHEIMYYQHKAPTQAKYLTDAFLIVMYNLVTRYGKMNIPDFYIGIELSVEEGVKLRISKERYGGMITWRKWVGA